MGPHQIQQQTVFRHPRRPGALGGRGGGGVQLGLAWVPGPAAPWEEGDISSSNTTPVHWKVLDATLVNRGGRGDTSAVRSGPLLHNPTLELPARSPPIPTAGQAPSNRFRLGQTWLIDIYVFITPMAI